ncbi:hypothetical protein SERLA73DRAFT_184459 [Serpula lacrymans var. lacrymans S7.3]|uniref:Uncharacterized protein n=2 Tax=Serpula lacrymans var. lacrymans TaxID=341189 RepID=F8Q3A1_SERL3|nr:uncharacterized protein SERLADRAFT_472152 [Serpula lacrymans var. lacrymans S7.9]EGN97662.1 hypothetical protein SERLA73DRAFT_184459 [Serpula lacrymans var. lacrymans S7.3]EGO23257.1 hypothetical protein SERLADRAFT_472152 [Serpula lacrymans var. lacrymans S7.9]
MLHNVDNSYANASLIPEEGAVNRHWRWGDAMNSTVTLPSEESTQDSVGNKKRRSGRLGMSGLRDMLRSLKRSHSDQPPIPASTSSLSTNSSHDSRSRSNHPHAHVIANRRRSKASTGPDSMRSAKEHSPTSPYNGSSLTHKASPRRPSLASIFRLGQKNKVPTSGPDTPISNASEIRVASSGSSAAEEEDWDRIDSASDLDAAAKALGIDGSATIKGKRGRSPYLHEHNQEARPVTPKRAPSASQTSFWEEHVDSAHRESRSKSKSKNRISLPRESPPPSKSHKAVKSGSVRSAPPQPLDDRHFLPDFKLAMTPENIKPLLENAKEVHIRLIECIKEVQVLLNPQTLS